MLGNGAFCLFSTFLFPVFSMFHFLSAFRVLALQISTCINITSLFLILWMALYMQGGAPNIQLSIISHVFVGVLQYHLRPPKHALEFRT